MKFEKEVLVPGVYVKGGESIVVTEDDCRDYFASLQQIADAGLDLPLMYEHSEPGLEYGEGAPGLYDLNDNVVLLEESDDIRAERLKRTVGKVDFADARNRINERGGVTVVFDVPNESAQVQLASGLIRHVSAELRPTWRDGKHREYRKVFGHFALTHRPVQVDQQPGFAQLSQKSVMLSQSVDSVLLSMDELVRGDAMAVKTQSAKISKAQVAAFLSQFADDDENDDDKKKKPGEKDIADGEPGGSASEASDAAAAVSEAVESVADLAPENNPDLPADDSGRKTMEALLAHLTKMGLPLQADTTSENLAERLLTAVMTYNAVKDQSAAESSEVDAGVPVTEESGAIAQMSEVESASHRTKLVARVNRMRDQLKITPAAADKLRLFVNTVQFSTDGVDSAGLSKTLDAFEGSLGMLSGIFDDKTSAYQLSSGGKAVEIDPPDFVLGGVIMPGDVRAETEAESVLSRHPGFRRK